ncbi:MAG TPA: hypothetical protein VK431_07070 [Nitrosopumilaceae archaeon]|nr:hypothetical protein [Nitrosopumilaceae archaeon]
MHKHRVYDMAMDAQKSKRIKIIKFIIGGLLVGFSGYRFIDIASVSPFWATHPGIAVLVIGIVNIFQGILSKGDSKMTRTIETGIGISGIVVGLFAYAYITDTSSMLSWLISLFLIIQSVGFIVTGFTQSGKSKAIRIPKIIIGAGIIITLTGSFFVYHDLPITLITILLTINLFIIGMEIITSAISHKIAKRS